MRLFFNFSLLIVLASKSLILSAQCPNSIGIETTQSSHTIFFFPIYVLSENEEVVGFQWELGDGTVSTIEYPVHTYDNPNTYQACLTLTTLREEEYCTVQICEFIEILQALPCSVSASFEWVDAGLGGVVMQEFCETNTFTQVLDFQWEGSEGQVEEGPMTEFMFENLNSPEVCLTVHGVSEGNSCSSTICKQVQLEVPEFTMSPEFIVKADEDCSLLFINATDGAGLENIDYQWIIDGEGVAYSAELPFQFEEDGEHSICLSAQVVWYGELRDAEHCEMYTSSCNAENVVSHDFDVATDNADGKGDGVNEVPLSLGSLSHSSSQELVHFKVYDVQGKLVYSDRHLDTYVLNASKLGKGMFIIHIFSGAKHKVQKVFVP